VWGCQNSGLFHSFSKFILHRLRVDQRLGPNAKKIKVTLLSRDTKYRRIENEESLLTELKNNNTNLLVRSVRYGCLKLHKLGKILSFDVTRYFHVLEFSGKIYVANGFY